MVYLSINSIICMIFGSVLFDSFFSSLWVMSPEFYMPDNFWFNARKQFDPWVFLLDLIGGTRATFSLGIIFHYWSKIVFTTLMDIQWIMKFPTMTIGYWHCFQCYEISRHYSLLGVVIPQIQVVSSYASADQHPIQYSRKKLSWFLKVFLCTALGSSVYYPVLHLQLMYTNLGSCLCCSSLPSPRNLSPVSKLGQL